MPITFSPCQSRALVHPPHLRTLTTLLCGFAILATNHCVATATPHPCWTQSGQKYNISPYLLWAIARHESGFNPHALNRNSNGSEDVGLMQINSAWLPTLARFGIRREHLFDPCTAIDVGAWVLAQNVAVHGYNWVAVGAYNARSSEKQYHYARRIYRSLAALSIVAVAPGSGNVSSLPQ